MILVAIITILMVAGLISWLLSKWNPGIAKWIALVAMIVDFFIVCNLWAQYGIGKITGFWNKISPGIGWVKPCITHAHILPWHIISTMFLERNQ